MSLPTITALVNGQAVDVSYAHAIEGYTKGVDERGPYYGLTYQIADFTQADGFANALLGIGRNTPHRYPLSPNLVCTDAHVEGLGRRLPNDAGTPSYAGGAVVRAQYRAPAFSGVGIGLYEPRDDPGWQHQLDPYTPILWCTQEVDWELQTLTYPKDALAKHGFEFESDHKTIETPLQVDVPIEILNLTFHRLAFLPAALLRAHYGRVNSTSFLGCAVGTVRLEGARSNRDWNTDGTCIQRLQLVFKHRTEDWRKTLREDSFVWDFVLDPDSNYRYLMSNFNSLLNALAPPL